MAASALRIVPLGGLGEIGMNCLALEQDGDVVLIDCGTRFPSDDCGVDVIHPDFRWLLARRERVLGVVLTHGHEDHIGALPYLLRGVNVPVHGPGHALRLVQLRLARHEFHEGEVALREVALGQRLRLGPFEFEPIRVSHSITQATALCVRSSAGTLLHTGDFKFDPAPSDGELTDERRLREIGEEGVDVLLSDSTNVDETGSAGSESDVQGRLQERIESAEQRAVVALFASNVQRLLSLGIVAKRTGRRIGALGTSLLRHIEVAREMGVLDWPRGFVLAPEQLRSFPRRELLLLASGTQAEPGSAMWRLSRRDNRFLDLEAGDRIVFSSRIIPGRERQVVSMICDLLRLGVDVDWGRRSGAHTSGHACRDEQRHMIELLRPRAFVPVHGTLHHLKRHAELARELGVSCVQVVENGHTLVLLDGVLEASERVDSGEVFVGNAGEALQESTLARRRELCRGGHLTIVVSHDQRNRLLQRPALRAQGLPECEAELALALERGWGTLRRGSTKDLELSIERFVAEWLDARHGFKPVLTVVLAPFDTKAR